MGDVDYYLIRVHPFGGYSPVPVPSGSENIPNVSAHDWRFPTVDLAAQWADGQDAPGGISFHEECGPIGDFAMDYRLLEASEAPSRADQAADPDILDKVFALADGDEHAWGPDGPAFSELGQVLFSNTFTYSFSARWATSGIGFIAEAVATSRGESVFLDATYGADAFENDLFVMRSYCWCDGVIPGHEENCPPNFVYKPTGLTVTWYKHAGRGITADRPQPDDWSDLVLACIQSVSYQEAAA